MICNDCGIPMLLVYTAEEGWIWICSRCYTYEPAHSVRAEQGKGMEAYRAFKQYQEGEFEAAEECFHELVKVHADADWQIGCRWHELLSRYGVVYSRYGNHYALNLWRFPLPDLSPRESEVWRALFGLITDHGCLDTVRPKRDALCAEISALRNRTPRRCRVYINWNIWDGTDRLPPSLGQALAYRLGLGNAYQDVIPCFLPQMHGNTMQNYGATAHAAMEDAELMIVLIGQEGIDENSPFSTEIGAFWRKSGMNCGRVLLCMDTAAPIVERIPQWMRELNWGVRWSFDPQEPVDEIARRMAAEIRNELMPIPVNQAVDHHQEEDKPLCPENDTECRNKPDAVSYSDEANAAFKALVTMLREHNRNEVFDNYAWVPMAERFWNEQNDVRFAGPLLHYYVLIGNRERAQKCYQRLISFQTEEARKVARMAIESKQYDVKNFLNI